MRIYTRKQLLHLFYGFFQKEKVMGCWRERVFAVCAVIVLGFVSSVPGFAGENIFYDGSDASLLQEVPNTGQP